MLTGVVTLLLLKFLFETVVLFLALWGLVRAQKFQYEFWGIAGTAVLAGAVNQVPLIGRALSVIVLTVCLRKITREDFVEIRFTIAIAWVLSFAAKFILFSCLIGDLRTPVLARMAPQPAAEQIETDTEDEPDSDANPPPSPSAEKAPSAPTNSPPQAGKAVSTPVVRPPEAKSTPPQAAPTPPEAKPTLPQAPPAATPAPAPPSPPPDPKAAKGFSLKGIIRTLRVSTAIIDTGVQTYSIDVGEALRMDTLHGRATVSLQKLTATSATVIMDGTEAVLTK